MTVARVLAPALISIAVGSAWLGAATIVAAAVAPAAFAVLPSRTLAGALVGRVLPVLFWSGMVASIATLFLSWSVPGRTGRIAVAMVWCASCAAAQLIVAPRIARVRAAIGGPVDALAVGDPRRVDFGRLHALSVGFLGIAAVAALIALLLLGRSMPFLIRNHSD